MNKTKHTIYIEPDDDITAIISSIKSAPESVSVIALVLPKRGEALKSLVSMKLISASAKKLNKRVVLVTTDPQVLTLATATQIYVAKSLSSKPVLLAKKIDKVDKQQAGSTSEDTKESGAKEVKTIKKDSKTTKKSGKGKKSGSKKGSKTDHDDPLTQVEADYLAKDSSTAVTKKSAKKDAGKSESGRGFRVPDFEGFRKKLLILIVAVIVLLGGAIAFGFTGSSAEVIIRTKTQAISTIIKLEGSTDEESDNLLLVRETINKQLTQPIVPTGTEEVGDPASGVITVTNCTDSGVTVPSGTTFSAQGLNYISSTSVSLSDGNFTGGGVCKETGSHVGTVSVNAEASGGDYNIGAQTHTIGSIAGDVRAFGSAMTGGFSETVQIIQESDIETALDAVRNTADQEDRKEDLRSNLAGLELIPLEDTFSEETANEQVSVSVGQATTQGIATIDATFTMIGVNQTDVLKSVLPELESLAGELSLIDSGIDSAKYTTTKLESGDYELSVAINAQAGTDLSTDSFFDLIMGRPADEAAADLRNQAGVSQVEVSTSPFWSNTIPLDKESVTITVLTNE